MKWMKGTSKGLIAATLAALLMPIAACVQDVGDIDRTQANALDKTQFAGVWYYVKTVVDIPFSSGFTFQGETNFGNGSKIVFDVQEKQLIAYPILETVKGSEGKVVKQKIRRYWDKDRRDEFIEVYVGSPVATWPITSHFDIKRDYSVATGEQSNVIVENTTDRPWYLRDYMRVDWGSELVREAGFITGNADATPVHYVQDFESKGLNPDAPVFEEDYFDIVTKYFATPSLYACAAYGQAPGDCAGAIVKVRHSFRKALPNDDYIVRVYSNREHMEKFGFFLAEHYDYDEYYGITESARDYKAQLWNIWGKAQSFETVYGLDGKPKACNTNVDCDEGERCMAEKWFEDGLCQVGTPLPYKDRGLNPIIYHMSAGHPGIAPMVPQLDEEGELVGWEGGNVVKNEKRGQVHPLVREAYETADGWSDVFKDTVAWLYYHEEIGLLHPEENLEGARACEANADCTANRTDILYTGTADTAKEVEVICTKGSDCNAYGGDCMKVAGESYQVCGKTYSCSVNSPCPYGMSCADGTCKDGSGSTAIDPIDAVKNPRAYTFILADDGNGGVAAVRTTDGIFPGTQGTDQASVRFVNATKGQKVSARVVSADGASGPESTKTLFENISFKATDINDVAGHLDMSEAARNANEGAYVVQNAGTWLRLEIVDGSGKVLAKLTNVEIAAGKTYVFAFIGGNRVVKATSSLAATAADRTQGVRVINGVKDIDMVDVGLDSVRIAQDSKFGDVGAYVTPLKRGLNSLTVLKAGVPGDITCYHENDWGKCVGWAPRLDATTDSRVAELKGALPEMFALCEPVYTGDSCTEAQMGNMKEYNDCRYSTRNEDGTIANPCKDKVSHPGGLKKVGDARYNQFYWVGEAQAASPLGYGPTSADPETGRSFYAAANIYGASLITYGQYAADLIDLVNGNLSVGDTISGKYVRDFIEDTKKSRSPEDYTSLYEGLTLGSSASGNAATADEGTYEADQEALQGSNPLTEWSGYGKETFTQLENYAMSPKYRFRAVNNPLSAAKQSPLEIALDKLKGTHAESLLINDEVKLGLSGGALRPGDPVSDEWSDAMSPTNWLGGGALRAEQKRMALLTKSENCVYMPDFVDGSLYGLSKEIGCSEEAKKAGAQSVTDYLEAANLIDENRAATGKEEVPAGYCLEGDALRHILTARIYGGVLEHEVGHTMGLRHNFAASNDVFNYFDEYYEVREKEAVRCIDLTGCNFARGEQCYTDCQGDTDCARGTVCVSGQCTDPASGKTMGQCVAAANVPLAKDKCTADLAKAKGGDLVPTWDAASSSCVQKAFCGKDFHCGEGEVCNSSASRCEPVAGAAKYDPAVVSSCTTRKDCGEGGICSDLEGTGTATCWTISPAIVSRPYLTQSEQEKRRTEFQLSTVMDYGQKINADIRGLGKYDYASIKFGYGDLVEVYKDITPVVEYTEEGAPYFGESPQKFSSFTKDSSIWMSTLYHPFFFLNYVITIDGNLAKNRTTVPYQQVKLSRNMNYDYNNENYWDTYIEVPYDFCSDEYRGNGGCLYFDMGADYVETTQHAMEMLTMYYIFDAFQRERFSFGWGSASYSYYARIMDRWMNPLRLSGLYFALYENIFSELSFWDDFSRQPMSGEYFRLSSNMAYQYLHQLIASPAPGRYTLDTATNTYVNVSYDTTPVDDDKTLVIPVGKGKFPWTTFDTSYGFYAYEHPIYVGSYWEKLAAMQTLTDASISFLSDYVGEALDIGVSSAIGFVTAYPRELTNLFGGIVADAWEQWAGVAELEPGSGRLEFVPRSAFNPSAQSTMPTVAPSISTLSFKTLSAVVALATLPAGFDPSITDSMAVVLEGNASDYELGAGMDWKKFTDPFSYKTYLAIVPRYDSSRLAVAARIVDQANALKKAYFAATTDTDKAMYAAQLKEAVEVLDLLRELNETLGVIRY